MGIPFPRRGFDQKQRTQLVSIHRRRGSSDDRLGFRAGGRCYGLLDLAGGLIEPVRLSLGPLRVRRLALILQVFGFVAQRLGAIF